MGLVGDFKLRKRDAGPRMQQIISEIVSILNEDGYQRTIYLSAPTSSSSGYQGEKRIVREGVTLREYVYEGAAWWKSDPSATTGWSLVT